MGRTLHRSFFEQPVDVVARELIGCHMIVQGDGRVCDARITETEAYGGFDDAASHAFRGPTPRSAIMFGPAGHIYVYKIYGIHWCMNVVTQRLGSPSAVLLRAASIQKKNASNDRRKVPATICRGPGNLTRALGITGDDNGTDSCRAGARIFFRGPSLVLGDHLVGQSTRVGISRGKERRSRYFLEEERGITSVSRLVRDED